MTNSQRAEKKKKKKLELKEKKAANEFFIADSLARIKVGDEVMAEFTEISDEFKNVYNNYERLSDKFRENIELMPEDEISELFDNCNKIMQMIKETDRINPQDKDDALLNIGLSYTIKRFMNDKKAKFTGNIAQKEDVMELNC